MSFFNTPRIGATLLVAGVASIGIHAYSAPNSQDVIPILKAFKVVTNNGVESLVAADTVKPGDTMEYRVVYRNNSTRAVKDLHATLPIPSQLRYVPGSATPSAVQASTDGRTYATPPLRRRVTTPTGVKIVTVPVSEYRYLRWSIGVLPAGGTAAVAARAALPQ